MPPRHSLRQVSAPLRPKDTSQQLYLRKAAGNSINSQANCFEEHPAVILGLVSEQSEEPE
ncbi:hypothetical protein COS59_00440 [Candidatus Wolfebacteria bacterium CG03_land_8_20_14_0_80_36_15]|uniref:Uncharacterized protein n=1 Tax=Candidatus Wolfebacteria bacterium CG03_land_8_20_14_0_80_36_15 TaxID=1975067 RepID=A0A2M7B856_9BACT|nr:MAG: hypothetical protein COS59_00440 [Candidatus Wolfebacteria bacterium CG03_land_8_20_14_0_80_36_15]